MILLLAAVLAGLAAGLLTGGSLRNLQAVRLRWEVALFALLVLQLLLPRLAGTFGWPGSVALGVWLLAMAGLVVAALRNSRAPGMVLAAVGVALNLMVIGLNLGMPVSERAIRFLAGSSEMTAEYDLVHRELGGDTLLPWLADVIPVPGPKGLRAVVSVGDLLLVSGVGWFLFRAVRGEVPDDDAG
ncbi:MAG: DUF5317 family protein [Anaerosomatales bacterium]|nr:DUF5317 family protein [Anaerosomatales bacterium]